MKHAYVEVTHAVREIAGEIVVMDLYQMVCICQNYWDRVTINKWYCRRKNNSEESGTDGGFCENLKAR